MSASTGVVRGKARHLTNLDEIAGCFQPGSSVVLHTAYAEPKFLGEELARLGPGLKDVSVYTMMPMSGAPYAAPALDGHLVMRTFFPGKALRGAVNAGRAHIVRASMSEIPGMYQRGEVKADVLLLQVSPPDAQGRMSLGLSLDYMMAVLTHDPIVIAEVNPAMPFTCGASWIGADQVDYVVDARTPPETVGAAGAADAVDSRIAENIASLIGHGAVIQVGIGAISDLVLGHLTHVRDLGIHSGIITDAVMPLIERGVVTNATKRDFTGKTVTTMAGGTLEFYQLLHQNPLFEFHPCTVTHDAAFLASIDGLCAINTVLQIDLSGRANAEQIDGRTLSSVGGLHDFAQGAAAAKDGRSIITLRAASRDGKHSNILPQLPQGSLVTVEAKDIDYVVTEFGVAHITGLAGSALAQALIAVAHPDHRADLKRGVQPG